MREWMWWAGAGSLALLVVLAGLWRRRRQNRASTSAREPWALRYSLPVLFVGAVGAFAAFVFAYRSITGEDKDRVDVGVKAATATAAVAAGVLTWGRLELSRRDHRLATDRDLTERYGRAVEQLGNTDPVIRAGGVYALERFALDAYALKGADNETDWRMALDVLAGFVREHLGRGSTEPSGDEGGEDGPQPPRIDVGAALVALGRFICRAGANAEPPVRYNLHSVDLSGRDLFRAYLDGADLTRANLGGANLTFACLTRAILLGADLTRANLDGADLTRANLGGADLTGANLGGANLTQASLADADLTDANLRSAILIRSSLFGATLADANLGTAARGGDRLGQAA